jgi:hypothetical protein
MEAPGLVFHPSHFKIVPVTALDSHVYSPADGRILFPTIRLDLKPIGALDSPAKKIRNLVVLGKSSR